jgi:hypothetical protein
MAVIMEINAFWDMMVCHVINIYTPLKRAIFTKTYYLIPIKLEKP